MVERLSVYALNMTTPTSDYLPTSRLVDRMKYRSSFALLFLAVMSLAGGLLPATVQAQNYVCLPAPRLLTTTPMGGQVGTEVVVTIAGDAIEAGDALMFSERRITAQPKLNDAGKPEPFKFLVTIPADCAPGLYEARVMTRLGISSPRIFSVSTLTETSVTTPNTSASTAKELVINSICNSVMSTRAVDHYQFEGQQGQRIVVECATRGIDSKLDAVIVVADAAGRDLLVERRGGLLDYVLPATGKYLIKVHELTFKGGQEYFYRLVLRGLPAGEAYVRHPVTRPVNASSWPPSGLPEQAALAEIEPNNDPGHIQKITLPADISGAFAAAADVDMFELEAVKGEEWWVEVASERLGLPTDPNVLVQHVDTSNGQTVVTDVVELTDIPSPVKLSSNGYAYDGPYENAGSLDVLGKVVIQKDGTHRLQISDLLGGTRTEPRHTYRLLIRKATPDFAVVAWPLHMELRNGDRNALNKPLALRNGGTVALEVVAVRRDGFDGEIDLKMEGLPEGVTAQGLKIEAGKTRGILLLTASQNAPRALADARFIASAVVGGQSVQHSVPMATNAWSIQNSWSEVPCPRLAMDMPVSVSGIDFAPITIAPEKREVHEAKAGSKLTIPLIHTRRTEFLAATMICKTFGAGFNAAAPFEISVKGDRSEAVLDLAALKTPPGDYMVAFYGGAVAAYRDQPERVVDAEIARNRVAEELKQIEAELMAAVEAVKTATAETKMEQEAKVAALQTRQKDAQAVLAQADQTLKAATAKAQPKDIVDIVVTEPVAIRVLPAEKP